MGESFETDLDRLAALQELDRELLEKQRRLEDLTQALRELEEKRARMEAERQALETENASLQARQRELSSRMDEQSNRIRDSRMRMNRARTEREVLALKFEVNQAQEKTRELEDELLAVYERLEVVGGRLAELREGIEALERELAEERAARDGETEELNREIEEERSRREAVAAGLDAALRARYERILERRGGLAVVEVRGGTCLGCHMRVPPQLFNELLKYRDIRECPNCHRILFWKPEPEGEG